MITHLQRTATVMYLEQALARIHGRTLGSSLLGTALKWFSWWLHSNIHGCACRAGIVLLHDAPEPHVTSELLVRGLLTRR